MLEIPHNDVLFILIIVDIDCYLKQDNKNIAY